jgi:integrase
MPNSHDVRFFKTEVRKNAQGKVTSYRVQWSVDGKRPLFRRTFRLSAQAESFRSELVTAANRGEPFDTLTGLPARMKQSKPVPTWYEFALQFVEAKWPYASPNHRRGIAEAVTDATEVMVPKVPGAPSRAQLRAAMLWATSVRVQKAEAEPPSRIEGTVRWLERNSYSMALLADTDTATQTARAILNRISRKQDGKLASGVTIQRKRAILGNLMGHAIEAGLLTTNPLKSVKWAKPKVVEEIDEAMVVNPEQAGRLLRAVREQGPMGERLEAFFGCIYYAALRPEEIQALEKANLVSLPENGWGWFRLYGARPSPGKRWTDDGQLVDKRSLKHRVEGESRPVPIHPELCKLLRRHMERFPTGGGPIFRGPRGGRLSDSTYLPYFHRARLKAFTEAEAASRLAKVPYDLRHAAVSTWLAAGVPPKQVALWAGHGVDVLLRVYAKVLSGHEGEAMRRILEATTTTDAESADRPARHEDRPLTLEGAEPGAADDGRELPESDADA